MKRTKVRIRPEQYDDLVASLTRRYSDLWKGALWTLRKAGLSLEALAPQLRAALEDVARGALLRIRPLEIRRQDESQRRRALNLMTYLLLGTGTAGVSTIVKIMTDRVADLGTCDLRSLWLYAGIRSLFRPTSDREGVWERLHALNLWRQAPLRKALRRVLLTAANLIQEGKVSPRALHCLRLTVEAFSRVLPRGPYPELLEAYRSAPSSLWRSSVAKALARLQVPNAEPLLIASLKGMKRKAPERPNAVEALGFGEDKRVVPLLFRLLEDRREPRKVRAGAVSSLATLARKGRLAPRAIRRLIRGTKSAGGWRSVSALMANLGDAGGAAGLQARLWGLRHPSSSVRFAAIQSLWKERDRRVAPALVRLIRKYPGFSASVALESLIARRERAVVPALARVLPKLHGWHDKKPVAIVLAELGDRHVFRTLVKVAREEDPRLLGTLGDPRALPILIRWLDDKKRARGAGEALIWLVARRVVAPGRFLQHPALLEALGTVRVQKPTYPINIDAWNHEPGDRWPQWRRKRREAKRTADARVRRRLKELRHPALVRAATAALRSRSRQIRMAGAIFLALVGEAKVLEKAVMKIDDQATLVEICRTLHRYETRASRNLLVRLMMLRFYRHPLRFSYRVSQVAADALLRMGTKSAIAALERATVSSASARYALGRRWLYGGPLPFVLSF